MYNLYVHQDYHLQAISFHIKNHLQTNSIDIKAQSKANLFNEMQLKNTATLQQNGISSLSFSKNGAYCAVGTKNNSKVYIFQVKTFNDINSWVKLQEMSDHTQTISDIDWSEDQKILTASHDRSVFVWRKNNLKWEKMLVNIDVKLSVLCCKWAPSSKKFVLGCCPSTLIIGFYSPEAKCWTATVKQKVVKAPIVSVDFHPSCNIIAIASVDGSVKIVSCSFKKSIDPQVIKAKVDDYPYNGPFQKVDSLAQTLYSIDSFLPNMNVWINHVSFQNNGKNVLVLTHSSHFKYYDVSEEQTILTNERDNYHKGLPFVNGLFNPEKQQLVLAGFDRKVSIFAKTADNFKFDRILDKNEKSNKFKTKGMVESLMKNIQKKQWTFGSHPNPDEHLNTVKVVKARNSYVSYDLNGIVHFWE